MGSVNSAVTNKQKVKLKTKKNRKIIQNWQLYIFILPALLYFIIFHYVPMYGIQIAFKDYVPSLGFWEVNGLVSNTLNDFLILIISGIY